MALRLAFAGTPEFAAVALGALHRAGFPIALVLTQPDRPAGRGLRLQPSAVKRLALSHDLPLVQPRGLRLDGRFAEDAAAAQRVLRAAAVDVVVVAAYGLILPAWFLALPQHGCMNIHASLLPRWRGAAPIHRALEAGDVESGITIMQMDEGLDTGPILLADREGITPEDTTATLQARLSHLGGRLMVQALRTLERDGSLAARPQPADGVTYAAKIDKAEAPIDWRLPAATIERRLRAFDPSPGAQGVLGGMVFKLWRGRVAVDEGAPGSGSDPGTVIVAHGGTLRIACGEGALDVLELQRAGGRRLPVAALLQGGGISAGMRFEPGGA